MASLIDELKCIFMLLHIYLYLSKNIKYLEFYRLLKESLSFLNACLIDEIIATISLDGRQKLITLNIILSL